jgi:V8-like Glu-specific endopeptidase
VAITEVPQSQIGTGNFARCGVMFVTYPNGSTYSGSCAVVGLNDIITAGHMVYNPDRGGYATNFEFYFGADYNSLNDRFDSYSSSYSLTSGFTWTVKAWPTNVFADSNNSTLNISESQYDVALIGVSVALGNTTGWFGIDWARDYSQYVNQVGYPGTSTGMMTSYTYVTKVPGYGVYEMIADIMGPGSSGGPLFTNDGYLIGVKSSGDSSGSWFADVGFLSAELSSALTLNNYLLGANVDDYSASTSTIGRLNVGAASTGVIEKSGDTDWFAITLVAGTSYKFSLTSSANGLGDPMLKLYSTTGSLILSDDDSGSGLDSEILFTPSSGGAYYLEARASTSAYAVGSATGGYVLSALSLNPTYKITSTNTSFNEGANAVFNVVVTNVLPGTTLNYSITGVTSSDVVGGQLLGSIVIPTNLQSTISIGLAADKLTEGAETITVSILGNGATATINDTSVYKGPAASDLVYVFKSEKTGPAVNPASYSYYYTSNLDEAKYINAQANWPWVQKASTFEAAHSNPSLSTPVFRFWSDKLQAPYFTISAAERDQIIDWSLSKKNGYDWQYAGTGFSVYTSSAPTDDLGKNAIPVYCVWMDDTDFNPTNGLSGGLLFTADKVEYDGYIKLVGVTGAGVVFYGEVPGN